MGWKNRKFAARLKQLVAVLQTAALLVLCVWVPGVSAQAPASQGCSSVSTLEETFWEYVNGFRADPLGMSEVLGIDIQEWQKVYIPTELPPLAWSPILREALCEHVHEMVEAGFYSLTSPQGVSVVDRLNRRGYIPSNSDATLGLLAFRSVAPEMTVLESILKNAIREEIDSLGQRPPRLLSQDFREIGVCICPGQLDAIVGQPVNGYVYGLYYAANMQDPRPIITGRIYDDLNSSGAWDPGEGVSGVFPLMIGPGGAETADILTEGGIFSYPGDSGFYFLELWRADGFLRQGESLWLGDRNIRMDAVLP